ncbi:MAG TPA: hypothetical protein PKD24_06160 [Pyrinomonadaceae bacterium]|nr:hypothetical protein [Pyrinomonadaceae bacterium]
MLAHKSGAACTAAERASKRSFVNRFAAFLSLFVLAVISPSCGSAPTDPRTLIPADALIYLETKDLGAAVAAITENPTFNEAALRTPDLRGINGIELSVGVMGFETSERQLTEESSILNFQPRFAAVAETGYWNFQVISFVEEELGLFISEAYGGEAKLESEDKDDGRYYTWTAQDGRKAFAFVVGSLVIFGNDATAIEKCLAVKRGEAESIAANPKITRGDRLAFGYVSPEGVAQIANIAGISMAKRSSEATEVQSFIARIVPELLRNSLVDVTWTATKKEEMIEDRLDVGLNTEVAPVLAETLASSGSDPDRAIARAMPAGASLTRYDLRDPQVAWRSILLTAQKLTDELSGELIGTFSSGLFEPYGIDEPELFLSAIGPVIYTATLDEAGDRVIFAATIKDADKVKQALAKEFETARPAEKLGEADTWTTADGSMRAVFSGTTLVVGDAEAAAEFYKRLADSAASADRPFFEIFNSSTATSVTIGTDATSAVQIAEVITEKKDENTAVTTGWLTETRPNRNGIERRSVSPFGLIGTIITQFSTD